jgi:hypothetical protein
MRYGVLNISHSQNINGTRASGGEFNRTKAVGVAPKSHHVLDAAINAMSVTTVEGGPILIVRFPDNRIAGLSRTPVSMLFSPGTQDSMFSVFQPPAVVVMKLKPIDYVQGSVVAAAARGC